MAVNLVPVVVLLAASVYLFSMGAVPVGSRARSARRSKLIAFFMALAAVLVALGWPLDGVAQRFQWAHMVQHMLLIALAAPLFVVSDPWLRPLRSMPRRWRGPAGRIVFRDPRTRHVRSVASLLLIPAVAWVSFHVVFFAFHLPALYDLTLRNPFVHGLEHLMFLGFAVGFWVPVIRQPRMGTSDRLVYLMAAGFAGSALGLWLVTAPAQYGYAGTDWLTPASDQRLAAGVMGGPGSVMIALAAGMVIYRWLGEGERAGPDVAVKGGSA
jgi:putative membrane protein